MTEASLGTNQSILRYAAYDADDDLRIRREFHEKYSRRTSNVGFHEWIASQMPMRPTDTLLDVGTGPGDFPQLLRRLGHEGMVVGMDLSEGMVRTAHQNEPQQAWLVADAQALPFADGTFDGTMARHMLYHVPDIDRAVQEMARVTKVGGWVAAVTNARDNMITLFEIWNAVEHSAVAQPDAISARFPLEQAAGYFTPYFSEVQTIINEDAIELPLIDPLLHYLFSGRHLRLKPNHTETEWREVQEELVERAEALWQRQAVDGMLSIPKRMGLVVGYRR